MSKLKKLNLPAAGGIGRGLAVLMTVLLCIPGAAVINGGILPLAACDGWACGAAGVAVFAATMMLGKLRKRQALPTAGIIAGGYILLCAALCAFGEEGSAFGPWLGRLLCAVAAGGVLGAVMSIRQNPHKKRRR